MINHILQPHQPVILFDNNLFNYSEHKQFINACKEGNNYLINNLILKKEKIDLNIGLICACDNNKTNTAILLVENGAKNLNGGMIYSSMNNNKILVEYFISKGADDFQKSFENACNRGHIDMMKFLMKENKNIDLNLGLKNTIYNVRLEASIFLIELGCNINILKKNINFYKKVSNIFMYKTIRLLINKEILPTDILFVIMKFLVY